MWLAAIAVSCVFGCNSSAPANDAGFDGGLGSFTQPIGASCDSRESLLCARGLGLCHDSVCCVFCSAVELPHCPSGTTEVHETLDNRELCLCTES